MQTGNTIADAYEKLLAAFGPQGWWPAETGFETALGAVLTQATAWRSAKSALANLRAEGGLEPEGLAAIPDDRLLELIGPAGFQRRKASTIRGLNRLAGASGTGWDSLLSTGTKELRSRLLSVAGIGPETADAIVLYAAGRPSFVIDAYTTRFAVRHGLAAQDAGYDELQRLFESALPKDPDVYAEYHALLVELGKRFCRAAPRCRGCPMEGTLRDPG